MNLSYTRVGAVPRSYGSRHLAIILFLAIAFGLVGAGSAQANPTARAVNNFSQCQTSEFLALLDIDHQNGDFAELEAQQQLMELCTLPSQALRDESRVAVPEQGVINFETSQVHPLALTPDGSTLLAVNTSANTLEVFSTVDDSLVLIDSIPVGHDPVSVRARTNNEVWVVNNISDSLSIIDLGLGAVIRTLQSDNEPADVVFAESQQRAFVSSGDKNRVLVFALDNLDAEPQRIELLMEEPRALAISPDGSTVYVAAFESGNATTAISGRSSASANSGSQDIISRVDSPYAGQNPVPNNGATFSPALTAGNPGASSLVVRKDDAGRWMDDNSGDWSAFVSGPQAGLSGRVVGWDMPDNDLAQIDTQTLAVSYTPGLMNINAALAVNPLDGRVAVVGTDATNEVRFQANLNGIFLQVLYAAVGGTQPVDVGDLNPHLDYSLSTLPATERARAVGDPRGVVWAPDGSRFFVSGMGSNNIVSMAADGSRLGRLEVGEGPTGIALNSDGTDGFVLNRFDGSVSRFDPSTLQLEETLAFFDPTPESIKTGRPHLYNTHKGSGLGQMSCASCHVDARTDRLAWDLGEPDGASNFNAHPMKGAMQTQSLVDIIRFPNLHWRGDRNEILDFNATFSLLQGAESQLNGEEIAELEVYLATLHFAPNPNRNLDNSLSTAVELPAGSFAATGNAVAGRAALNSCIGCHSNGLNRSNQSTAQFGQNFIPPAFHGFYKRLGYRPGSTSESLSGYGAFHDGADSFETATRSADQLAALLSFDGPDNDLSTVQARQDTHAAVGHQLTFSDVGTAEQRDLLSQMLVLADSVHLDFIAKRGGGSGRRGYLYLGAQLWQSDREGETITQGELLASADASHPVSFTLVVAGTGERLGLDKDLDGEWDNAGSNAAPVFGFTGIRASKLGAQEHYQLPATDLDNSALTYSAVGLPVGLLLDVSTGVVSGVPTQLGESVVLATVSDGESSDRINITWRVLEELPVAPSIKTGAIAPLEWAALLCFLLIGGPRLRIKVQQRPNG